MYFVEYEQHQRQVKKGKRERRVLLSVLACGVYSVAAYTMSLVELSVHLLMSKPIQYAM